METQNSTFSGQQGEVLESPQGQWMALIGPQIATPGIAAALKVTSRDRQDAVENTLATLSKKELRAIELHLVLGLALRDVETVFPGIDTNKLREVSNQLYRGTERKFEGDHCDTDGLPASHENKMIFSDRFRELEKTLAHSLFKELNLKPDELSHIAISLYDDSGLTIVLRNKKLFLSATTKSILNEYIDQAIQEGLSDLWEDENSSLLLTGEFSEILSEKGPATPAGPSGTRRKTTAELELERPNRDETASPKPVWTSMRQSHGHRSRGLKPLTNVRSLEDEDGNPIRARKKGELISEAKKQTPERVKTERKVVTAEALAAELGNLRRERTEQPELLGGALNGEHLQLVGSCQGQVASLPGSKHTRRALLLELGLLEQRLQTGAANTKQDQRAIDSIKSAMAIRQ